MMTPKAVQHLTTRVIKVRQIQWTMELPRALLSQMIWQVMNDFSTDFGPRLCGEDNTPISPRMSDHQPEHHEKNQDWGNTVSERGAA